jgi:hypothetical protein
MSDDIISHASFHITYVPSKPPVSLRVSESNIYNKSSIQIIYSTSIHMHRCRSESFSDDCSCQDNLQGASNSNHTSDENYATDNIRFLSLLVSPTLTSKFINAITSVETDSNHIYDNCQARPDYADLLEAESDFRRSIHPCLCHDESFTICKNTYPSSLGNGNSYDKSKDTDSLILPRLSIYGIITSDKDSMLPADIILFQHDNLTMEASINGSAKSSFHISKIICYSSLLNHETASDAPWSVMKAFPVRSVSDVPQSLTTQLDCAKSASSNMDANTTNRNQIDYSTLPCCPVCIHRIDPAILGLPALKQQHKCFQFCSTSNYICDKSLTTQQSCANEMKLDPWPPPARCNACNIICQRGSTVRVESFSGSPPRGNAMTMPPPSLACQQCGMTTTLWVCLTCGAVGCGRYTLKHAADHFTLSGHPYSLELATMRIWDYKNGSFVHRRDLLECPVLSMKWGNENKSESQSLQFTSPLIASSQSGDMLETRSRQFLKSEGGLDSSPRQSELLTPHNNVNNTPPPSCQNTLGQNLVPDKLSNQPKKSLMISQEYEVLLHSALEDQAIHFEGEISHLRAQLASSRMKNFNHLSDKEAREINALRNDNERLKRELNNLSSVLLESQTNESKSRALSQKLLREQSISKELLERLRKDISEERNTCRQRLDELDMEIEDLTANLRMMSQIAGSEELSQAQIVGTAGGDKDDSSTNKKKSRKLRFGKKK